MPKVVYYIKTPDKPEHLWDKFEHESPCIPRIGEQVIRHAHGVSSFDSRYRVFDVIHVFEARPDYVEQGWGDVFIAYLEKQPMPEFDWEAILRSFHKRST